MMSRRSKTAVALIAVLLVVALPTSHTMAATTDARLLPTVGSVGVGQLTALTLQIDNVQNLYGYQVSISFNPALLEVVDSDPGQAGVQVGLGTFVKPEFVVENQADNNLGTISAAATQISPTPAVYGSGALLTISFRGKAQGVSDISINSLILSSMSGTQIPANTYDAQIGVGTTPPPMPTWTVPALTPLPTSTGPAPWPSVTPVPTMPPGGQPIIHVVQTGDTLYSIARRYGVTIECLMQANGIYDPHYIQVGQQLIIPRGSCVAPTPPFITPYPPTPVPPPHPCPITYVVQPGDTLYSIARRYGTTVEAIARDNHIVNPHSIWAGQQLVIHGNCGTYPPTPMPPCHRVHIVQPGETLCSIARRYGTTAWTLAQINNLPNPNVVYAGQELRLPC